MQVQITTLITEFLRPL